MAAIVPNKMLLRPICDPPIEFFDSLTLIVGHDEDPLALVRCAAFRRAEYAPRRSVTHSCQVFDDVGQPQADMSFDVFKEADPGSEKSNTICNPWPEVPRVLLSFTLPGCTEWLAGISPSEDVHAVTKCSPREGLKIRPDRCRVHESRFHFADQIRNCEGFDLTKSDCAQIWDCSLKSKLNAAVSSAEAKVCNCFGSIHVIPPSSQMPTPPR
jgi:hypothetical protein